MTNQHDTREGSATAARRLNPNDDTGIPAESEGRLARAPWKPSDRGTEVAGSSPAPSICTADVEHRVVGTTPATVYLRRCTRKAVPGTDTCWQHA